ncbi:MAG: hypothetical protein R6X02_33730 [Enhygromyxa sp.]
MLRKLSPLRLGLGLLLTTISLGVTACDSGSDSLGSSQLRSIPDNSVPSEAPEPCGDALELPDNAVLMATEDQTLLVTVGFEDPQMAMAGAGAWEYWCECTGDAGACQVQVVGQYTQCFSQSCTKCERKSRRVRAIKALAQLVDTCDPATIDDAAIAARLAQLEAWTAERDYPAPVFEDQTEALAPEGFGLVVELVGGRMLTYAVPLEHFDEDEELLHFVGPANEGAEPLMQAAGGGKVSCSCDGSGECSFSANGLCKGLCSTSGAQRGCVVKSTKPLIPIK